MSNYTEIGQRHILIATYSGDYIEPVVDDLHKNLYSVTVYESDKVAAGEKKVSLSIGPQGDRLNYDGKDLDLRHGVRAAWYRRPNVFPEHSDKGSQVFLDRERQIIQDDGLWGMLPENAWLNSPRVMRSSDKLGQLMLARSLGFDIPETVVGNDWENVSRIPSEELILKSAYPLMHVGQETRMLFTTRLKNDQSLQEAGNPFPGIWQEYIDKAKEWRVTIVGDEIFDTAIYTDPEAKDDWRKHQNSSHVQFRKESLPAASRQRCFELVKKLGLKFGAIDLAESHDGKITFFEINPNGQYGWLEQGLDRPVISQAIAHELIKIARSN